MILRRSFIAALVPGLLVASFYGRVMAFPVDGDQTTLRTKSRSDAMRPSWP